MTDTNAPKDKYNAVWLIFFMISTGTLLPWNVFIAASNYFIGRLKKPYIMDMANRSVNWTDGDMDSCTILEAKFENALTLCSMIPVLVFTCLTSFLHGLISEKCRIMGSLTVNLVVFLITAIVVKVEMEPLPFFSITMIETIIINSFGAIQQGSLCGMAGQLPASYTMAIMSGEGLSGTIAAFSLICSIASGSDIQEAAIGNFITACVVISLSILSYLALHKMEFFQSYQKNNSDSKPKDEEEKGPIVRTLWQVHRPVGRKVHPYNSIELIQTQHTGDSGSVEQNATTKVSVLAILKKMWVMALSVCLNFIITIGIFPAVTLDVKSTIADGGQWEVYFIPVCGLLLFSMTDWAGRSLTAVCMLPGKDSILLPGLIVARVIFMPLFMLTNVQPRYNLHVYFEHDAWFVVFVILFAISNGYLATLCMCYGPKNVLPHEAETAGAVMMFFLSLGMALGAALSFLCRAVI